MCDDGDISDAKLYITKDGDFGLGPALRLAVQDQKTLNQALGLVKEALIKL
jgi:hypothetical protein